MEPSIKIGFSSIFKSKYPLTIIIKRSSITIIVDITSLVIIIISLVGIIVVLIVVVIVFIVGWVVSIEVVVRVIVGILRLFGLTCFVVTGNWKTDSTCIKAFASSSFAFRKVVEGYFVSFKYKTFIH